MSVSQDFDEELTGNPWEGRRRKTACIRNQTRKCFKTVMGPTAQVPLRVRVNEIFVNEIYLGIVDIKSLKRAFLVKDEKTESNCLEHRKFQDKFPL